jgi:hypothetical protein
MQQSEGCIRGELEVQKALDLKMTEFEQEKKPLGNERIPNKYVLTKNSL